MVNLLVQNCHRIRSLPLFLSIIGTHFIGRIHNTKTARVHVDDSIFYSLGRPEEVEVAPHEVVTFAYRPRLLCLFMV